MSDCEICKQDGVCDDQEHRRAAPECPPVIWEGEFASINDVYVGRAPERRKRVCEELKFVGESLHCTRNFFSTRGEAMTFVVNEARELWNKIHVVGK